MSKAKPFLWIYEVILVIGFLRGLFLFGDPSMPRVAICISLAVNLLLQYGVIKAIRAKPIDQLPPAEQATVKMRQKAIMKTVFTGAAVIAVMMLVNVGLFIKHLYSVRAFASVQLVVMALFFCYIFVSFRRLQKRQG